MSNVSSCTKKNFFSVNLMSYLMRFAVQACSQAVPSEEEIIIWVTSHPQGELALQICFISNRDESFQSFVAPSCDTQGRHLRVHINFRTKSTTLNNNLRFC